ncbi:cytochrome P450 [Kutzneria viridogrisea]|uniref:Cytochrome P450 n=1 Tax=Kutzneria viridogrisea TaxID=47990 RepID=A0ABR6B8X0_9PSEU|nr:cytochrome P450 [Kutzneria viridogrisea]
MTGTVPTELVGCDLTDPQTYLGTDVTALWRAFRRHSPVHRHPPSGGLPGFWAVTRYADVLAVYRDDERFTSERGNVLSTLLQGEDSAAGKMLAVTDGHRHREIRKLMLRSFSPRVLARHRESVRARTSALLAAAVREERFDFATRVADHIPINTMGDLMDVPEADRAKLVEWNTETLGSRHADGTQLDEVLARNEILLYFSELAEHRRRHPGEDVISALANGSVDGEPLSDEEVVLNCYSLILGGDESSRLSATGAVVALAEHPEQWRALKDGSVGLAEASEEVLRWTTPAMHFGRRARTEVQVGDQLIAAGDIVTLWNSSANFDEDVFAEPERFDLARTPNKHLTFGYGPHFCLGAYLGRAHVEAVLEALREQVAELALAGPGHQIRSNFVYGYLNLPVSFRGEKR